MKKIIPLLLVIYLVAAESFGQKFISENNKSSFFSEAPMENIEAHSYKGISILNVETGEIVFSIPIRTFEFEKSLMQEHFNENYLESHQYPKAKFKGKIVDFQQEAGKQQVTAKGTLEIHGVSQEVSVPGELIFDDQEIKIKAIFPVKVADYNISIPKINISNIAEIVEVTLDYTYVPYEKL